MNQQTPTDESTGTPKKKQVQPKHHAGKSHAVASARREKIIKGVMEGKPLKQIGLEAGLSPKTADSQVSRILQEPQVKNSLLAAMERIGINDVYLAEQYKKLIEGKKYIPSRGDAEAPYIEIDDLQAKAKALELAFKLTGRFIEKHEVDVKPRVKVIIKKFCSRGTPPAEEAPA